MLLSSTLLLPQPHLQSSPYTLSSPVSFKLDEDNFLQLQLQALATICGHKLQNHLEKEKFPKRFSSIKDQEASNETQEYQDWLQQDQLLVSWLLALIEKAFANRMVGCKFAH